ncbi:MAG: patatin-like phospholipase family protein [Spirochaetia bacterium]|nr:patatin-like phospholipase family protein [Spirochaetia bacterium]
MNKKRLGPVTIGAPVVGLALGSGAARGWAHIGVIHALEESGIPIHVVAGTSAGAAIGAFYAAGALERLWTFAQSHKSFRDTFAYLDFSLSRRGLVEGARFVRYLQENLPVRRFEDLKIPFGAVATNLVDLSEIHLTSGALLPAVRASVAVPGFFTPEEQGKLQLVDGGLVNPVPVSLARRLGADIVIAVDLNTDVTRGAPAPAQGFTEILARSLRAMSNKIRVANRKEYPADITIEPVVESIRFMDYHKTEEVIEMGHTAALAMIPEIKECLRSVRSASGRIIVRPHSLRNLVNVGTRELRQKPKPRK